ncbi:MAG: glutamine cyclotransferase [Flavobacteriales bacterium]|nr:MAG: glutamine cyclotransferase [Flavobacteriales bacterium]
MKVKSAIFSLTLGVFLFSCESDKEFTNSLIDFNQEKELQGYHFGEKISFPEEITKNIDKVNISFGEEESDDLTITPKYFHLGGNKVNFNIQTKGGKNIQQEAIINVFTDNGEKNINYTIAKEYPHSTENFVQGFELEGNTIYESEGGQGNSHILKYQLGQTHPTVSIPQSEEIFAEGCTVIGDKIYQLTWLNKKGFIYDKATLKLIKEFDYPNSLGEGWGLTYDGEHLIVSDGSNQLYFLDPENPSEMVKTIFVAGNQRAYPRLNELEYHNGFIYANVWQEPIIVKINPKTGEAVGKFDFSEIVKKHTTADDDVLNGITFKGDNMLITGKNWNTIYEVSITN